MPDIVYLSEDEVLAAKDLERHSSLTKTVDVPAATLADAVNRGEIPIAVDANGTRRSRRSDVVRWLTSRGRPKLKGRAAQLAAQRQAAGGAA